MNLKKFGMALFAILVLGAVMASSALAVAEKEKAQWYLNGSETPITEKKEETATAGLAEGTKGVLETEVGETPLTLESAGLECLECKIYNEGGEALGKGKLKFTGVTVATPSGCEVSGGAVTTNTLGVNATYMGTVGGVIWNTVTFTGSGTSKQFAIVTLVAKAGKTCAISGPYIVKGTVLVKTVSSTNTFLKRQFVQSSKTINKEGGGTLEFGSKTASLTGEAWFEVGGATFATHK